jgi:hypothetical protein
MKHERYLHLPKILGWSSAIGLGIILTACSVTFTTTPAPIGSTAQAVIRASPTALPPTHPPIQPSATAPQPTATMAPTAAAIRPTVGASDGPACTSPAALTPAQTEGPYYKPNSPERASLSEPGIGGTKLIVTGYVLTKDCQPIANAWLDFWQADDKGAYDNAGYRLRGHLFTDETGRYTLETIVPGEYPGRTEHIHAKVQAPNSIFDPALLADVQDTAEGKVATFNFVLRP